jgi:hypothetical protein
VVKIVDVRNSDVTITDQSLNHKVAVKSNSFSHYISVEAHGISNLPMEEPCYKQHEGSMSNQQLEMMDR